MGEHTFLQYQPVPGPPRPSTMVWIAWVVIIGIIAMSVASSTKAERRVPTSAGIQLDLVCRYVVGEKVLMGGLKGFDQNMPALVQQTNAAAISKEDRLDLVPVLGELQGKPAAREALAPFLKADADKTLHEDALILQTIYADSPQEISPEQAKGLIDRHGWYGRLAVSSGLPDSDPVRQQALAEAKHTLIATITGVCAGLAMGALGLVLLIVFVVKFTQGKLRPMYPLMPASAKSADIFVEAFAVYMVGMVLVSLPPIFFHRLAGLEWDLVLIVPVLAALFWARARGIGWAQMRRDAGWTVGRGVAREMVAGFAGYIAGIPLITVGFVLASILGKLSHQQLSHPIGHYIQDAGPHRVILFGLACVFAPIAEETMFRGFLLAHVRLRNSWLISATLVSVIFAAIHPQGWPAIPVLGSIAFVLAALREQRGSLIASMTAHATNNLALMLVLVFALS